MNRADASTIIAIMVIAGFFILMMIVLTGFVRIEDPTVAKLVGALFGYLTALLNPVVTSYFRDHRPPENKP